MTRVFVERWTIIREPSQEPATWSLVAASTRSGNSAVASFKTTLALSFYLFIYLFFSLLTKYRDNITDENPLEILFFFGIALQSFSRELKLKNLDKFRYQISVHFNRYIQISSNMFARTVRINTFIFALIYKRRFFFLNVALRIEQTQWSYFITLWLFKV